MPYYAPFYRPTYYAPTQVMADANNQFNQFQQPQPMQQPPAPFPNTNPPNNDIIWVQGEAGAKAYLVAPNATVTLWDSENPTIYVKSADASGIPSMRVLDFTERTNNTVKPTHECQCSKNYVKMSDFYALEARLNTLQTRLERLDRSEVTDDAQSSL